MSEFALSVTEVRHVRAVVELCAEPAESAREKSWAVLEELQALVGCDGVALNGLDPRTESHYHAQFFASGERWMDGADEPDDLAEAFWLHYPSCLPCSYPDDVGDPLVVLHADFYSEREWLAHPMRREVLTDVRDEMLLTVPDGDARTIRLIFPRSTGRPFGERERFTLTLLTPHLEPLLRAARTPPPVTRLPLTDRQWQILERVRLGLANKQIARELDVSPATVRKHLENVYRQLDVQSRGAAVHLAFGETDGAFQRAAS